MLGLNFLEYLKNTLGESSTVWSWSSMNQFNVMCKPGNPSTPTPCPNPGLPGENWALAPRRDDGLGTLLPPGGTLAVVQSAER